MGVEISQDADAKVYTPHADKIVETADEDREAWKQRLEKQAEELADRERELDAREQSLDEREQALRKWEEELKSRGIDNLTSEQQMTLVKRVRGDKKYVGNVYLVLGYEELDFVSKDYLIMFNLTRMGRAVHPHNSGNKIVNFEKIL